MVCLKTERPPYSQNGSVEGKAQATEEQQDGVTMVKSHVPEAGNRKLDLRVGKHPSQKDFPRGVS
jgi:hypothetical protein